MSHALAHSPPAPAGLRVADISVKLRSSHGVIEPVSQVSLDVGPGERVALVGESGCGKSMLLRSLLHLVPPQSLVAVGGHAQLDGDELIDVPPVRRQSFLGRRIGIVFQDAMTYLNPTMTIGAQVREALSPMRGETARARIGKIFASVGLDRSPGFQRRYPHELSGGMRQRVLVAIALAGDPELLFADEPTTALDVTVQAQLLATIDAVVRSRGMGLLLVTHDLGVVAQMCERMYVMYAGQIVESGPVDQVFAAPQHPYTQALLDCLLTLDRRAEDFASIPGVVPAPWAFPTGCRFANRCAHAMPRCGQPPPVVDLTADRTARCWLRVEDQDAPGRVIDDD